LKVSPKPENAAEALIKILHLAAGFITADILGKYLNINEYFKATFSMEQLQQVTTQLS